MPLVLLYLPPLALRIGLRYALGLALAVYLVRQFRKPSRWTGRLFLRNMNKRHSPLTDWGLQQVRIGEDFAMLDVGCGGGRTIQKLAALAVNGKICGVDYAKGSIAATCATNAGLIATGRVAVVRASVSSLPFPASRFDLVTAVETQYFWPDVVSDMKEVRRVLKPGGRLVVIAEAYKAGGSSRFRDLLMKIFRMSYFSVAEHRELFSRAGYEAVEVFEERKRGWVCAMGRNPKS